MPPTIRRTLPAELTIKITKKRIGCVAMMRTFVGDSCCS
jgi:hypothetical protein